MVSVWQKSKGVDFLDFRVIPMHKFEKYLFRSNDGVVWNVVCQTLKIYLSICGF